MIEPDDTCVIPEQSEDTKKHLNEIESKGVTSKAQKKELKVLNI